jgi:hypothetical protein
MIKQLSLDCEIIDRAPVLVEKEVNQSLPEQEDFAISISGEAIIYDPNAKPVEFKSSNAIDESYIEGLKVGDRIKFRAGYRTNLDYERKTGIITAIDNLNIEVIWEGEDDSDCYSKSHIGYGQWWEKLDPLPSIDAVELPVFEDAIAPEPSKSVVGLRIDERSVSVLVEKVEQPVLVESDRLQFLLEQRDRLINSGASPQGVWLCSGKVPHRDFIQVVWKADKPHPWLGDRKSRYIGKLGGEDHLSAIAQHRAGQELRKIEREIKKITHI